MVSGAREHQFGDCRVLGVWGFFEEVLQVCEGEQGLRETKGHPAVRAWVWPPIGKKPETPPAESVLKMTPVCKEPPAARGRGPRDQRKNPGRRA